MGYDSEFFKEYFQYTKESRVHEAHGFVLSQVRRILGEFDRVVDLGCGSFEFLRRFMPDVYVGIDKNGVSEDYYQVHETRDSWFHNVDYRELGAEAVVDLALSHDAGPFSFVSLFSTECTAPAEDNYCFYSDLFSRPEITSGLVSGFYYTDKFGEETVSESGEIVSYQTIDVLGEYKIQGVTETRIALPVPSKMFGPNVVEVWKYLKRV